MPKKSGIVFVLTGAVLILSALLLHAYNRSVDNRAGEQADAVLTQLQSAIPQEAETMDILETVPEEMASDEMPTAEVDGDSYIGYLAIPALELELPVMADWNYSKLKVAPCRHFGSTKTDDLVIAAHNYSHHFGRLKELAVGETVSFTDMEGTVIQYRVDKLDTLDPDAVDAVQYSDHDLVLYTCTYGGENRVAVFCNRET